MNYLGNYLDWLKQRGLTSSEEMLNKYLALVTLGLVK